MTLPGPGLPDVAALVVLLVALPALSWVQLRDLDVTALRRMPVYVSSAVALFALGLGAWLVGSRSRGVSGLGLGPIPASTLAVWTAALVAAGLALTLAFRRVGMALGARETPLLRALLPRTGPERAAFAGLSVVAGVGEELAYRGYAIPVLGWWMGAGWAALVTSVVFGVLHGYQGPLGVARTAAAGGVLAAGFLASGSLWPALAAHVVMDVVLGVVLAERMMVPDGPDGVRDAKGDAEAR